MRMKRDTQPFPQQRKCRTCGAEFTARTPQSGWRCRKCRAEITRKAAKQKVGAYIFSSDPTPESVLHRATRCPKNTSPVRWRIEQRRRASADYYRDCCPSPEVL